MPRTRFDDRQRIERWFVGHGVPAFVEGYARGRRLIRWLVLAGLISGVLAIVALALGVRFDSALANVGVVIGAIALSTVVTYVVIRTGIVPIALFAFVFFFDNLRRGRATMLSVIPLLLVAVTFFFLTTETWQTMGRLHGLPLVLTTLLFAGLGLALVTRQVKPDLDKVGSFDDASELAAVIPSDLHFSSERIAAACSAPSDPLRRSERRNLLAVTAIAQLTVAAIVGLAVFTFFMVFGVITVGVDIVGLWTTGPAQVWWQATIAGHDYALTSQHARVSTFLGVFSAFYFVVSATTNEAMRASLSEGAAQHARTCLAVRSAYRARIRD